MKKLLVVAAFIQLAVAAGMPPVYAGRDRAFMEDDFKIPPEIEKATTVSQVEPFLEDRDAMTRAAAAMRLGKLGDPEAVSLLAGRFAKEPYQGGIDSEPYVKMEIITALEAIGGKQAKAFLLDTGNSYWRRGPRCDCKKCKDKGLYPWHDGDYHHVLPAVLMALGAWQQDEDVFNLAERMALDEKLKSTPVRQGAWELYLKAKMAREGLVGEEEATEYLANFLAETGIEPERYVVEDGVGVRTLKSIKNDAAGILLRDYGEPALSFLKRELERASISRDEGRVEALNYAIGKVTEGVNLREKGTK